MNLPAVPAYVTRSHMLLRFQQTAWLKSRSGPMVLEQQDEAQTAEFFRFGCIRGDPGHAAATRTMPEEAYGYWLSGVSTYETFQKFVIPGPSRCSGQA